jgi:hypothetical protein
MFPPKNKNKNIKPFLWIEEPAADNMLNVGVLIEITGGDTLLAQAKYSPENPFCPKISISDDDLKRCTKNMK